MSVMFLLGKRNPEINVPMQNIPTTELLPHRVLGSDSAFFVPLGNSPAMPKTKLSRAKMCRNVFAAIQEYPGCKAAKEVKISEVADARSTRAS